MTGFSPRERTGVQWARIAAVLAGQPAGLTISQIAERCGYTGRSRERAIARCSRLLRRMERHGLVTRCVYGHGLIITWRLAGAQGDSWLADLARASESAWAAKTAASCRKRQ